MKNIFYVTVTVLAIWLVAYFTVVAPREEKKREFDRQVSLSMCYDNAEKIYISDWNYLCNKLGRGNNCLLSNTQSDNLHQGLVSNRINCEKMF